MSQLQIKVFTGIANKIIHYKQIVYNTVPLASALHEVQANETSFKIKNLHPGASYTVSIAGETMAGKGPNSTVNFETHSEEMGTKTVISE